MTLDVDDQQLIALVAAGDQSAVTTLYDRHIRLLWSLVVRILRDPAEAQDVVQDLFVRVWQQSRAYNPARGEVKTWICQMARTMAIDRLRSSASRSMREQGYGLEQESQSVLRSFEQFDPDWVTVRRALGDLPPEQKSLIECAYFEGLSQTEIASRFGLPLGTVKTRIRQGMTRLRGRLSSR